MEPAGSITRCIDMLKRGDRDAAQELWGRYYGRLVGLARAQLRSTPRRAADEEDVALGAFDRFYRAAEGGRFPQLADRDDLWQLLLPYGTLCVLDTRATGSDDAERRRRHSHAERGNEGKRLQYWELWRDEVEISEESRIMAE